VIKAEHQEGNQMTKLRLLAVIGIFLQSATPPASANSVDLLPPFTDFALREPQVPNRPEDVRTYSATGNLAQWAISQWDIPGEKLSPFAREDNGGDVIYTATAPMAAAKVVQTTGSRSIFLTQNGEVLPCRDDRDRARESDLFLSARLVAGMGAASGATRQLVGPLSDIDALRQRADVSVNYGPAAAAKGCEVNKGAVIVALILSNPVVTPRQTLFYQLSLTDFCLKELEHQVCHPPATVPAFFSKKNPFGVDERIARFGVIPLRDGESKQIDVDLLPHLTAAIHAAPPSMDSDLSHWHVTGAYGGQIVWGDVSMSSTWREYRLIAATR